MLTPALPLLVPVLAWLLFAAVVHALLRPNIRLDDPRACLTYRALCAYSRIVHRVRVEGRQHIPRRPSLPGGPGELPPLLIVANHTAPIDPLVIQSALNYEVRWIMGLDMAWPSFRWLWDLARVILIDRRNNESAPLREAIRHLKAGGVIGVFPEGFIERPPHTVLPFREGVGLLVSRSKADVLPVVIDGTPQVEPITRALWQPSRTVIRFLPVVRYEGSGLGAGEIAADLRKRFMEATGWPASEHVPRWENGRWIEVGLDGRYAE